MMAIETDWRTIPCSRQQLQLNLVLLSGQSFRWQEPVSGEYVGVMADRIWRLRQDERNIYFKVYTSSLMHHTHSAMKTVKSGNLLSSLETFSGIKEKLCVETVAKKKRFNSQTGRKGQDLGQSTEDKCISSLKHVTADSLISSEVENDATGVEDSGLSFCSNPHVKVESFQEDDMLSFILKDYFQLDIDLEGLYQQWSERDSNFKKQAMNLRGIRILKQDLVENLFSFICSSCNNISRISSMVEKLCNNYGNPIAEVDGQHYHSFPQIAALAADGVEEKLRKLGFGYRAKYISNSAKYIVNCGENWVSSLRALPYHQARLELMKLSGVGAKVADCVCLMSLGKHNSVPVDTHVWQFAAQYYLPKLKSVKSLTDKLNTEIGDYFRGLWGEYAGWAQAVLFVAELKHVQKKKISSEAESTTSLVKGKSAKMETTDIKPELQN